ncbi:autotransporter outer membrane beta-barrel domain-containing protein, partial [Shinella sumterensis]
DLKGRLGISADYEDSWKDDANQTSRLHAYGIANLYYNFQSEARTTLSGVSLSSEPEALWGGIGLGGTYSWGNDRYALYGEALVDTSLRNFGDSHALTGRMGFNMRF